MMRGSSGAIITVYSEHVTKMDPVHDRTRLQGEWLLRRRNNLVLPHVIDLIPHGYDMERLTSAPAWALDHMEVLHQMLDDLERWVWKDPAVVKHNVDATLRKVEDIVDEWVPTMLADQIIKKLQDVADELSWDDLRGCLTHGDCTFDNVMFRNERLVVIDPIPATITTGVPDLWSADMGHILRSVLGFERVRYDDDAQRFRITAKQLQFHVPDDHEWTATVFWAIVHLVRTLPYAPSDHVREMLGETISDAIRLF